jgi:hypothetical protein
MNCCGHVHRSMHHAGCGARPCLRSRRCLRGGVGLAGSTVAARTAENASAALDVLRRSISIDVHPHGGKTGITWKAPPSNDLAHAMRAGSLAVVCLADVPDMPVLGRSAEGALAVVRAPATGELYRHHLDRPRLDGRAGRSSGRAPRAERSRSGDGAQNRAAGDYWRCGGARFPPGGNYLRVLRAAVG